MGLTEPQGSMWNRARCLSTTSWPRKALSSSSQSLRQSEQGPGSGGAASGNLGPQFQQGWPWRRLPRGRVTPKPSRTGQARALLPKPPRLLGKRLRPGVGGMQEVVVAGLCRAGAHPGAHFLQHLLSLKPWVLGRSVAHPSPSPVGRPVSWSSGRSRSMSSHTRGVTLGRRACTRLATARMCDRHNFPVLFCSCCSHRREASPSPR